MFHQLPYSIAIYYYTIWELVKHHSTAASLTWQVQGLWCFVAHILQPLYWHWLTIIPEWMSIECGIKLRILSLMSVPEIWESVSIFTNGCSCESVKVFETENVSTWEGLEPPTSGFMPNALTIWAIRASHLLTHVFEQWLWRCRYNTWHKNHLNFNNMTQMK